MLYSVITPHTKQSVLIMAQAKLNNSRFTDIRDEPIDKSLIPIKGYHDKPIVPLAEAIKPVEHLFEDLQDYVKLSLHNCKKPAEGLTQDEAASIQLYTIEFDGGPSLYQELNDALRAEKRENLKPWFSYLKLFLTALYKLPSKTETIFRGVKHVDLSDKYPTGFKFAWWGVSSCTTTVDVLKSEKFFGKSGKRTLLSISCINAKSITAHSYYSDTEKEVILMPGSYFEVVGHLDAANDLHIIQLKEIEPPYMLLKPPSTTAAGAGSTQHYQSKPVADTKVSSKTSADNSISSEGAKAIAEALTINQILTTLDIALNKISDEGAKAIAEALKTNKTLTSLDINSNNISDEGAKAIAEALKINKTLTILDISNNSISDEVAKAIAEALKTNKTLTTLHLSHNNISSEGAKAIAEALTTNQTLTTLDINSNNISDEGAKAIAVALKTNQVLTTLDIALNKISDEGAKAIAEALKTNQTLTSLYMYNNNISDEGAKAIAETLKKNKVCNVMH
ncbi:unnamed protein product [Didymodactylos carnosus]|uniref:NAD(P)(+)--arginine ADP-ribosyltransferase n=1 Tax=Didymodactylos carnosus TaxID=1234261 RepID=A0A8S2NP31_9BILA|nr:unnamed protein product [Didymodactylos carnosus]CAF4011343.1 unnamed protein product [Didymodactylos carnosus]